MQSKTTSVRESSNEKFWNFLIFLCLDPNKLKEATAETSHLNITRKPNIVDTIKTEGATEQVLIIWFYIASLNYLFLEFKSSFYLKRICSCFGSLISDFRYEADKFLVSSDSSTRINIDSWIFAVGWSHTANRSYLNSWWPCKNYAHWICRRFRWSGIFVVWFFLDFFWVRIS